MWVIRLSQLPVRAASLANQIRKQPQAFLRKLVRGVLPLGRGVVLDTFAGAASTLAAAQAVGYASVGVERDKRYFDLACEALPRLASLRVDGG